METRITGGSMRGRRLRSSGRAGLRPTSERVRAAIFSIIGPTAVEGAKVLDLYAGTGALGIEALSRGASGADFVEAASHLCRSMRRSLVELGLADAARVYCSRVEKALDMVEGPYDLVLADPPYELDPWAEVMERLDGRRLLREGALVMAEHGRRRELDLAYEGMVRVTSRRYGDTSISIYKATSRDA